MTHRCWLSASLGSRHWDDMQVVNVEEANSSELDTEYKKNQKDGSDTNGSQGKAADLRRDSAGGQCAASQRVQLHYRLRRKSDRYIWWIIFLLWRCVLAADLMLLDSHCISLLNGVASEGGRNEQQSWVCEQVARSRPNVTVPNSLLCCWLSLGGALVDWTTEVWRTGQAGTGTIHSLS